MLNVARLKVLKEVAYRGSFSAAAEALSYTQSAVSQQIATLEAETGMALLERHPRGVSLTAGATLMPLAIATFRASYPEIELTLAEGEPQDIVARLRAGELDLALLFEFAGESPLHEDMTRVELLEDPMYLALPRQHPLAGRERIRLEDLEAEAWVQVSRSSPCARHVVRSCHAAGFEPNVSFESDDYQTVQGLVAAGVGVALIPELALSVVREDIAIRSLSPAPPVRKVIAAAPAGARLVPAAPAMLGALENAARRYETR